MITCKEAVTHLWEYLDRNAAGITEVELTEHLGVCRHCCGEIEFARLVRGLLHRSGTVSELTPDVRARLEGAVRKLGSQR